MFTWISFCFWSCFNAKTHSQNPLHAVYCRWFELAAGGSRNLKLTVRLVEELISFAAATTQPFALFFSILQSPIFY
jgi:hypothetical protein